MEPFKGNYFSNYSPVSENGGDNQYYDPFYVKHRKRTTKAQLKVLEKTFENCPRPDSTMRKKLADQLSMTPRSVQVWFQNRRAKVKKQQQSVCHFQETPPFQYIERSQYMKTMEHFELYPSNNSILNRIPDPYKYETNKIQPLNFVNYNEDNHYSVYDQPRFDKKMHPYN